MKCQSGSASQKFKQHTVGSQMRWWRQSRNAGEGPKVPTVKGVKEF